MSTLWPNFCRPRAASTTRRSAPPACRMRDMNTSRFRLLERRTYSKVWVNECYAEFLRGHHAPAVRELQFMHCLLTRERTASERESQKM